jgi:archaetidylinositol phosphate synthase
MSTTILAFKPATRHQESILSPIEKRTLLWMARRLPSWVTPDHLTTLGLLGMAAAGFSYYLSRNYPLAMLGAVAALAVNWFGDSLDGTLARVRNRQRPRYGFYVDHVVDMFGALFLVSGLGLSGRMSLGVAAALLIAYFMLNIEIYLATYCVGIFRLSFGVWGPTELRVVLAIGSIAMLLHPTTTIAGREILVADIGGIVAVAGIVVILLASVIGNTRRLYREETWR